MMIAIFLANSVFVGCFGRQKTLRMTNRWRTVMFVCHVEASPKHPMVMEYATTERSSMLPDANPC